jgi:hypothetical protein
MMPTATMCDMTAGFACDEPTGLSLAISAETADADHKQKIIEAIERALKECGFSVYWIPSM